MGYEVVNDGGGLSGDSGLGALLVLEGPHMFCSPKPPTTLQEKIKQRERFRAELGRRGVRTFHGLSWTKEEQKAWNALVVSRGEKPMLFGDYPMGDRQCKATYAAPTTPEAQAGRGGFFLAGYDGFGAAPGPVFGPECWFSGPNPPPDTLGAPVTPAMATAAMAKFGDVQGAAIAQACNRSASPNTCLGHHVLDKPFLGRRCQMEWRAWVAQRTAAVRGATAPPVLTAPQLEPEDNTMLYAGLAALAVVGIAGVMYATKKR